MILGEEGCMVKVLKSVPMWDKSIILVLHLNTEFDMLFLIIATILPIFFFVYKDLVLLGYKMTHSRSFQFVDFQNVSVSF